MPPTPADIERYLHVHIPLSQAMGITVAAIDEAGVRLCSPFVPNINHCSTAFGGSISALAMLAGWTLVHVGLQRLPEPQRIVIQRNAVEYLNPVEGEVSAFCPAPSEQAWQRFIDMLTRRSKSRIILQADIFSGGIHAARFEGAYVALR